MDKSMEKLASGERINRAGDDASGLAVSEKMRSQVRGLRMAQNNTQNGISFLQTTEGYLAESGEILQRMRELSVQSANGIYSDEDRMQVQVEIKQLVDEVDRIASHAQFNGMKMLQGAFASANSPKKMFLHIGANMDQRVRLYIGDMSAKSLGLSEGNPETRQLKISVSTPDTANMSIGTVDNALRRVNRQRADLGAYQNRLEHTWKGLGVAAENTQAAESRIRDTDMVREMVNFVKYQVLNQSTTSMLAQANLKSQAVLRLLG
jgi:flagellin